jgi:ABC-type Fe3+ transport system permease subunit
MSTPLAHVLVRFRIPVKRFILVLFLLPQAFPSLPIFANLSTLFYRWGVADWETDYAGNSIKLVIPLERIRIFKQTLH